MKTDTNESIHVTQKWDFVEGNHELVPDTDGLTKREYFAGQVMKAMTKESTDGDILRAALYSVRAADALINALNQ